VALPVPRRRGNRFQRAAWLGIQNEVS